MSRRLATCLRILVPVSLAAIQLSGCGGGKNEAPAVQPVAAATPAAEPTPAPPAAAPAPTPAPTPAPSPAAAVPVEAPPVAVSTPAPETKPPQPQQPDALQWMKDGEARRVDYERRMADAKSNLEAADLMMTTWERNILAFKNPYLARPKLSPEDSQAIAGMDGIQRVKWAEGRLSEVNAKREAAQKALEDLKANPPTN